MNEHIPAIVLAITCTVLAIALYQSTREIAALEGKITELESAPMPRIAEGSALAARGQSGAENLPAKSAARVRT